MKKTAFLIIVVLMFAFGARQNVFVVPKGWPNPVYNFSNNALTPQKIELGRALFYDPILSANNTISCANCHSPYSAFTHIDHKLSHGINDKIGVRNSPALMNLAWQKTFMWDGAINHLDVQALAPIANPDEMGSNIAEVVKKLSAIPRYKKAFKAAFGDTLITGERTLKCISQFMLTLVSADAKYDRVMRGEEKFTSQEQSGYALFRANCASCHKEPLFTNGAFEANGLPLDTSLNDIGRMKITQKKEDSLKFKVPSLRNIGVSFPYMHDGRFNKLSQVLNHYTHINPEQVIVSKNFKNISRLTEHDKVDLISFLLTLTDVNFIQNQQFIYPQKFFNPEPQENQSNNVK